MGALGNLFFLVTLLFFLCTAVPLAGARFATLRAAKPELAGSLSTFVAATQRYLVVTALFGAIVAVIDTGALWLLAVPLPLVWGLFSFITNFIPNIGFVIGVIPPALLALLEGGWDNALLVVLVYSGINVVIQTFIQPHYVGATVGLSAEMTFLSLVVWTFLLGPLGALLAVPMTLLVRALLIDPDGRLAWVSPLIATNVDPPEDAEAWRLRNPNPIRRRPPHRPDDAAAPARGPPRCPGPPRPPCRRPLEGASPRRGRSRRRGAGRGSGSDRTAAAAPGEARPTRRGHRAAAARRRRDGDVQRGAGMGQGVGHELADHQRGSADPVRQLPVQAGPADEVAGRPPGQGVRLQVDLRPRPDGGLTPGRPASAGRPSGRRDRLDPHLGAAGVPREQQVLDPLLRHQGHLRARPVLEQTAGVQQLERAPARPGCR